MGTESAVTGRVRGAPNRADAQADSTRRLIDACAALVRERKIVVVGAVAAGATRQVRQLTGWGAGPFLVVASTTGTGELPSPEEAEVVLGPDEPHATMTEAVRAEAAFAANPPAGIRAAVDAFDPDGQALVLLSPVATAERFCGRQSIGGRPAAYAAMEDKTLADALWDAAGVRRAPATVVPVGDAADIARVAASLDRGLGTVWSGDAAEGLNGGADRVRWVQTPQQAGEAYSALAPVSARIRVMPFLDGVPCSIHGVVIGTEVAVFRPVELVVLRRPRHTTMLYCGISTCWDPARADRAYMRDVARAVGTHLSRTVGYRGGYSVDGIMTTDGFRPTELNPRFAGGLSTIGKGVPDLPLQLLQSATVRGIDLGVSASELEAVLLPAADAGRFGSVSRSPGGSTHRSRR